MPPLRWMLLGLLCLLWPALGATQTVFDGLSKTDLAPANFCAYSSASNLGSPWRQKLPANPSRKEGTAANTIARAYINNTPSGHPFWDTSGDHDFDGCTGNNYFTCRVDARMVTFVAASNDPGVTFICDCNSMNYGCWKNDVNVCGSQSGWTYTGGRAPANLRAGFTQIPEDEGIGDQNWAVVQPNGDVIEAYHCAIYSPVQNGDEISARSGSRCNGGNGQGMGSMILSNLQTDIGRNGGVNTGPDGMVIGLKYWHTAPNQPGLSDPRNISPNQAIWMNTSCNKPTGFTYPATSDTWPCDGGAGLPTGSHLWLNLDHAGIDAVITSNPSLAPWRGVLYAAHDYGMFLGDTGCGLGGAFPALGCAWLETGMQVVANGAHNRWIDWMRSINPSIDNFTFQPSIQFNPFAAVVNNMEVLGNCNTGCCYAYPAGDSHACPDAVAPTGCPGATSTAPTLTITAPNSGNNVTVTTTPLTTLAGTATDDVGVTSITWACPTCPTTGGTATCPTCGASATAPSWSVGSIPLANGVNTITVTASDGTQTGSDSIAVTYTPTATPELVARYQFEGNPNDTSGKGNTLTLVGGPSYVSTGGTYGQGLQLNGTTQYATAASSASLNLTTAMTLAAWVRPTQAMTDFRSILMKNFVYLLYASSTANALCPTAGAPFVAIEQSGVLKTACGPTALPANQWTHVAGTLQGTTLTLWINGTAVTPALTVTSGGIDQSTNLLYVGNSSNTGETLPGTLDEVRVYNYALNATEIAQLATPTPGQVVRAVRHRRGAPLR